MTVAAGGKQHFIVLDGLRGVAALMVVLLHLLVPLAHGDTIGQIINHGYLAVDFFFILSGFVIAHAYDDRWQTMSVWRFCTRRLIRLHPLVMLSTLLGAATFIAQDWTIYPKVAGTSSRQLLIVVLLGMAMIPTPRSLDIRGWGELYPLNNPVWSLFYEYGANVAYALGIRRLSIRPLAVMTALAATAVMALAIWKGDLTGGSSLNFPSPLSGAVRVTFGFMAGVWLRRVGARIDIPHSFLMCSVLLVLALSLPRIGGGAMPWANGVYEAACVVILFPLVVAMGAGQSPPRGAALRAAQFCGDLSYPLYVVHFPLIYIYAGWVADNDISLKNGLPVAAAVLALALTLAYASLRRFDEPVRGYLTSRLMRRPSASTRH